MTEWTAKSYECTNSHGLATQIHWYDNCPFNHIMIGFTLTLFSAIREPGVAMQCTKSLINPLIALAIMLISAMLLQEGF